MSKPKFDPSRPFEVVQQTKPKFDPSQPYEVVSPSDNAGQEAPSVDHDKIGAPLAAVAGFANKTSLGLSDEAGAWLMSKLIGEGAKLGPGAQPAADDSPELRALKSQALAGQAHEKSTYDIGRDLLRGQDQQAWEQQPWAYGLGSALGIGASVPLMGMASRGISAAVPALRAGAAVPMLAPKGQSLLTGLGTLAARGAALGGATAGAVSGFGNSDANTIGGMLADTGTGAALGAATGGLLPVGVRVGQGISRAGQWAAGNLRDLARGGYIQPTPEALRLAKEGATLTLGQMDPSSWLARYEEIASNNAVGGSLKAARERGVAGARNAIFGAAKAPGEAAPSGATVGDKIESLRQGFTNAYDNVLAGERLQPEQYRGSGKWVGFFTDPSLKGAAKTKGAFEVATEVPDAPSSVKERALAWLRDAASRRSLVPSESGPDAGTVEARSVQQLRSDIRAKIRAYESRDGDEAHHFVDIYKRAENFVTELLDGQLPPEKAAQLKAVDKAFPNVLAIESAADRAFKQGANGGDFTTSQLLDAIRRKGSTHELESLARAAHSVTNATYPMTGIQHVAAEVAPVAKYAGPIYAHLANMSPAVRAHALRQLASAPQAAPVGMSSLASGIENIGDRYASPAMIRLSDFLRAYSPSRPVSATSENSAEPWAVNQ